MFQIILTFLAILQIADVLSTNAALRRPGIYEANSVMAWIQARLGRAWWVGKLAIAGAGIAVLWAASKHDETLATVAAAIAAVVYLRIVWQNLRNAK